MRIFKRILPALALLGLMPLGANAGLVTIHSGNGTVGGTDSQITDLQNGSFSTPFANTLGASDFASASSGPAAYIVTPNSGTTTWVTGLTGDPGAQWVSSVSNGSTVYGYTALYAISFNFGAIDGPTTLKFEFAADNYLGATAGQYNAANAGLFLNGVAIPGGTITSDPSGGLFNSERTLTLSLDGLIHTGTNTLYIDVNNTGGYSGVIFSATIASVPEPSTVFMGATAAVFGLVAYRRRKRVAA